MHFSYYTRTHPVLLSFFCVKRRKKSDHEKFQFNPFWHVKFRAHRKFRISENTRKKSNKIEQCLALYLVQRRQNQKPSKKTQQQQQQLQNKIIILAKALKIIEILDRRYGFYDKNRTKENQKHKERFHCSHKRRTLFGSKKFCFHWFRVKKKQQQHCLILGMFFFCFV